jgi:Lrp/AsnC family leucine-responsive transcriptional regulator
MMKEAGKRLLLELFRDSSLPLTELARRAGISRQTAAKKVEELKRRGVSFTVRVNPSELGLGTKAYIFINEDPSEEVRKRNEGVIRSIPQVSEFHRIFGRYSAVMVVMVKYPDELKKVVRRIHELKGVRETETFLVHSTIKDDPFAPLIHALEEETGE